MRVAPPRRAGLPLACGETGDCRRAEQHYRRRLWHSRRRQAEGVLLAAESADPCDLARIIDAVGSREHPAETVDHKCVEVVHLRVVEVGVATAVANHLALGVNPKTDAWPNVNAGIC